MFRNVVKKPVMGWPVWLLGLQMLLTACGGGTTELSSTSTPVPAVAVATTAASLGLPINPSPATTTSQPVLPTVTQAPSATSLSQTAQALVPATAPDTTLALTTIPIAVPATVAPKTTEATATAEVVAVIPARQASDEANFVYLKFPDLNYLTFDLEQSSLAGNPPTTLAKNVLTALRVAPSKVAFLQEVAQGSDTVVQLKLIDLSVSNSQAVILDPTVFQVLPKDQQSNFAAGRYGVENQAINSLALSPDGTQLAYTKANPKARFEGLTSQKAQPTELWVVNPNDVNPNPTRLVANTQDFMAFPLWSPDNNRLAFIRTTSFGTGAGFPTALWSVYKDGSRLARLTGPDLGKLNGQVYQALPAFNLRWLDPTVLAFQATDQRQAPQLWQHDLTLGLDFPRPLALSVDYNTFFCEIPRRYVFMTRSTGGVSGGIYSVKAELPAEKDAALPAPNPIDQSGTELLGCKGDKVVYKGADNKISLVTLKSDGTFSKISLNYSENPAPRPILDFSPDGRYLSLHNSVNSAVSVYSSDGKLLVSSPTFSTLGSLGWLNKRYLGLNIDLYQTTRPEQLLVLDTDAPAGGFKQVDTGSGFNTIAEDKSY